MPEFTTSWMDVSGGDTWVSLSLETSAIGRGLVSVAPVPAVWLDQVGRGHLAGIEGDDRDLVLVHDGEDPPAGGTAPITRADHAKLGGRAR